MRRIDLTFRRSWKTWAVAAVGAVAAASFSAMNLAAAASLDYDRDPRGLLIARAWGFGTMTCGVFAAVFVVLAVLSSLKKIPPKAE